MRRPPSSETATVPAVRAGVLDPATFRLLISAILTGGVSISAALTGTGLAAGLLIGWNQSLVGPGIGTYGTADFSKVFDNLRALEPIGLAQLGLLVLLATPVVRVGAAIVGFALERDPLYVVVSAGVLAILLISIVGIR